jgi:hypothetical protein
MIVGILLILLLQIIKGLTVEEIHLLSFKYVVPCVFYSEKERSSPRHASSNLRTLFTPVICWN